MKTKKLPYLNLAKNNEDIREELLDHFESFIDKGFYIMGDQLLDFEHNYSIYNKVNHAVGVSNGLDALFLCLKSLSIGTGDEVLVPSNGYIATVLSIIRVGAKPVFVEPNVYTYNIDPLKIESAITKKTRAIIPIHLYGLCCEMDKITEICKKHKIHIIEDNAQGHGSSFKGKLSGSWGKVNATSFYPSKNLGAFGDAGAITTNDEEIAKKIKSLRNYGSSTRYLNEYIGYNMRLDELQAGLLVIKLRYLDKWNNERKKIADTYIKNLSSVKEIILPITNKDSTHVYHIFNIRIKDRDELSKHLQKSNIQTLIHYPIPPHLQKATSYLGYKKGDFPIAEELSDTSLSLPIWPGMKDEQVIHVVKEIKKFYNEE